MVEVVVKIMLILVVVWQWFGGVGGVCGGYGAGCDVDNVAEGILSDVIV